MPKKFKELTCNKDKCHSWQADAFIEYGAEVGGKGFYTKERFDCLRCGRVKYKVIELGSKESYWIEGVEDER